MCVGRPESPGRSQADRTAPYEARGRWEVVPEVSPILFNRPFPLTPPLPRTLILIPDGSSPTAAAKPTWGGEIRKSFQLGTVCSFSLITIFGKGREQR